MMLTVKKAFSDLLVSPGRTLIILLALTLGLWGVGLIEVSYTILTRDLNRNFLQTHPAQAIFTSKEFNKLDLEAFRANPEIESAEFRDLALLRIEAHPNDWIPLWLFGVEDFNQPYLARLSTVEGTKVPSPGTLLMERDGKQVSNLALGSIAHIRSGKNNLDIPISGITFDPAQAPATQDHFIYAYVDKQTYSAISKNPVNQRLIVRFNNVSTTEEVKAAARRAAHYFQTMGIHLTGETVPKFNEHPHQWQLNVLLFLQAGIGGLAFIMAVVLVSQLMSSILARQIREIGVLKAIGGSRRQIMNIYLVMIVSLGAVAGAVAIPLAVASGYAYSRFVAGKLNFDILTQHLPWHVYASLIAISVFMPLLLSLPALLKGINVSVRQALSDYGVTLSPGNDRTARWLPAWIPMGAAMALRNTLRKKKRLSVTIVSMALGVAIFNTGFNVRASLAAMLNDVRSSMKHDVQVVLNDSESREKLLPIFGGIKNVERIEPWNGGRGELETRVVSTSSGIGIVAIPLHSDLYKPRIMAGQWLHDDQHLEVVMNQQALDLYHNPEVGSIIKVSLGEKEIGARLVGVVEELDRPKIYMEQSQYDQLANPRHLVNSLMFVAHDKSYDKIMALKHDIEAAITPTDLNVLYVMSQAERVKVIYDHLNIVLMILVVLSSLVLAVSAMGMASATSITILERTREIGVLRAMGATPKSVFQMFVSEGMVVGVASIIVGLILAWPLSKVAALFFGRLMLGEGESLRYHFSVEGFIITAAVTLIFGWLASRIPARHAVQVSIRDALAYE